MAFKDHGVAVTINEQGVTIEVYNPKTEKIAEKHFQWGEVIGDYSFDDFTSDITGYSVKSCMYCNYPIEPLFIEDDETVWQHTLTKTISCEIGAVASYMATPESEEDLPLSQL